MKNSCNSDATPAGADTGHRNGWRRVSPIAIAYFAFDVLKHSVNLWPALVGVWVGGPWIQELFWDYGVYLLAVVFVVFIFLEYWFFRFREESDRIQLQRGIFKRKRLTLYYDRVQQADISQPYYFRPFGLATLGLESAGSSQKEVDLPGLPFREAESLKTRILDYRKISTQSSEIGAADTSVTPPARPEFTLALPLPELARYGLMHNGLLFLLPLSAPFWQHFDMYAAHLESLLENSAVFDYLIEFTQGRTPLLVAVALFFSTVAGLISLFALSVVIGIVRFWDYRLTGGRDQYQYRAGLLTVKTRGFRLHKLQKVTVVQGLFARWLKRHSLSISKAGGITVQQSQEGRNFLIPVLDSERLREIMRQLKLPDAVWTPVSRFQFLFRGILKGIFFGVLAGALLVEPLASLPQALLAGVSVLVLCILASRRYWRRFGYYRDQDWLVIKYGFIGQTLVYVPTVKVQKIQLSQPPWLRLSGLAHLTVWSGDGKVQISYLSYATASAIRDSLLCRVITFRGRWF